MTPLNLRTIYLLAVIRRGTSALQRRLLLATAGARSRLWSGSDPTSPDPHRGSLPGTVGVQGYARAAQSYPWTASSVHSWKPSHAYR